MSGVHLLGHASFSFSIYILSAATFTQTLSFDLFFFLGGQSETRLSQIAFPLEAKFNFGVELGCVM